MFKINHVKGIVSGKQGDKEPLSGGDKVHCLRWNNRDMD